MRKIITGLVLCLAANCFAAVDVNQASEAELDGIKGIGPSLSGKILAERGKAPFRDWQDLIRRVPGIRDKSAQRLSEAGLSVNGAVYAPARKKPAPND